MNIPGVVGVIAIFGSALILLGAFIYATCWCKCSFETCCSPSCSPSPSPSLSCEDEDVEYK